MPRRPRLEVEGGFFHLTARGVNGEPIAWDDQDRIVHLRILHRSVKRARWICLAYCLMGNHFHLLVQTPRPTLSYGMQLANGSYAAYVNERWGRQGHLFGRRFDSRLIVSDEHLLKACRYIALNPERARLRRRPEDWRWSSYAATIGLARPAAFLDVRAILGLFASDRETARRLFRAFVDEGRVAK